VEGIQAAAKLINANLDCVSLEWMLYACYSIYCQVLYFALTVTPALQQNVAA